MVVFGLILLLVAIAVIIYVFLATAGMQPVEITYGVLNLELTPWWLFLTGGIVLAVATCALWIIAFGTRYRARRSKEVRELRRQSRVDHPEGRTAKGDKHHGDKTHGDGARDGKDHRDADRAGAADRSTPILPRQHGRAGERTTGSDPNRLDLDGR